MKTLTKTEQEVEVAILAGKTSREIAAERGRSHFTIVNQVCSVLRKRGVSSRAELAARRNALFGFVDVTRFGLEGRLRAVAERVAMGAGNRTIARELGVSVSTAALAVSAIKQQLGVRSRTALVVMLRSPTKEGGS